MYVCTGSECNLTIWMLYHKRLSIWLSSCLSEIFALANVNQQAQFLLHQIHDSTFLSAGKGISFSANKCHRKLKLPAKMAGQVKFGVTYISWQHRFVLKSYQTVQLSDFQDSIIRQDLRSWNDQKYLDSLHIFNVMNKTFHLFFY